MAGKTKTIIRVHEDAYGVKLLFQAVKHFKVTPNKEIKHLSEDDRKYGADWVKSGDLIHCNFDDSLGSFIYCLHHFSFSLDLEMVTEVSSSRVSELKKTISRMQNAEKKLAEEMLNFTCCESNLPTSTLLKMLWDFCNIQGGTLISQQNDHTIRKTYDNDFKGEFISQICNLLGDENA